MVSPLTFQFPFSCLCLSLVSIFSYVRSLSSLLLLVYVLLLLFMTPKGSSDYLNLFVKNFFPIFSGASFTTIVKLMLIAAVLPPVLPWFPVLSLLSMLPSVLLSVLPLMLPSSVYTTWNLLLYSTETQLCFLRFSSWGLALYCCGSERCVTAYHPVITTVIYFDNSCILNSILYVWYKVCFVLLLIHFGLVQVQLARSFLFIQSFLLM